jgi:hypothetical protein
MTAAEQAVKVCAFHDEVLVIMVVREFIIPEGAQWPAYGNGSSGHQPE